MNFVNSIIRKSHRVIRKQPFFISKDTEQDLLWKAIRTNLKGTKLYSDLRLDYITNYNDYVKHIQVIEKEFYGPYLKMIKDGIPNILNLNSLKLPVLPLTVVSDVGNSTKYPRPDVYRTKNNCFAAGVLLSFLLVDGGTELLKVDELIVGERYFVHVGVPTGFLNYPTGEMIEIVSLGKKIIFKVITHLEP